MDMGLTHRDLAKALGVSETTIKSYRRKFPACITVASKGKPIRFAPEAETVCRRIQALFALGMAVDEVRQRLAEEFSWIEPESPKDDVVGHTVGAEPAVEQSSEHKKALLCEAARLKEALSHTAPSGQFSPVPAQKVLVPSVPVVETAPIQKSAPDQKAVPENSPRSTPYTVLPPEVRTAISDMARSVVELTLQQKKLLKHVERLEARLEKALQDGSLSQPGQTIQTGQSQQALCPQTPIHEQIQMATPAEANIDATQISESGEGLDSAQNPQSSQAPEAEQNKSRNPLLKIFGLERHG